MSSSGVEVNGSWRLRKIIEVAEIISGSTPSTKDSENFDGDIAWVTPKDLASLKTHKIYSGDRNITTKGKISASLKDIPKESVIISSRAPVGLVAIAGNTITTNQGCKSLVPRKAEVDSNFLYYMMKHNEAYLQQYASGTTFEELSLSVLANMEFLFPPINTQQQIGNTLIQFDEGIANAYSQIKIIDKVLSNKFMYCFEQFSVNEKIKFDSPAYSFSEEIDSFVPRGWSVVQLQKIAKVRSGFPFKSSEYTKEGFFRVITIKNVKDNDLDLSIGNSITDIPLNMNSYCNLNKKDLLISLTGNVGRVALVYKDRLLLNQRVGKIETTDLYANYIYLAFLHQQLKFRVSAISNGSSQENVSPIEISKLPILLPPSDLLKEFNTFANPLIEKRLILSAKIDTLKEMQEFLESGFFNQLVKFRSKNK